MLTDAVIEATGKEQRRPSGAAQTGSCAEAAGVDSRGEGSPACDGEAAQAACRVNGTKELEVTHQWIVPR